MNKLVLIFMACVVVLSHGAERYKDRMFDVSVKKDVLYASGVKHLKKVNTLLKLYNTYAENGDGTPVYLYESETDLRDVDLFMDIYQPKNDTEKKRAAVLVMHGGAFAAGAKDDFAQHTVTYCDSLAARGYVTVAVGYRLGITAVIKDKTLNIDSLDFSRTVYRGIQDVRAAVRYVRAHADELGVDPGRIYLIGNSAGAILSLENIYMDKDSEIPPAAKSSPDLGGLDAYGVQGFNGQANAVAALWGAVHDPKIIEDVKKPVLLVHGKADSTVVFKTGRPLGNIANVLKNVMPDAAAILGSYAFHVRTPTLYGSYVIDSVLTANGVEHDTYFVEGQPHEFYDYEDYDVKVQEKVFNFLYAQTQKPAGTDRIVVALIKPSALRMGENNLSFTVTTGNTLAYAVTDLRGRIVKNGVVSAGETVEFSDLEHGVYVLRVKGERPVRFGLSR